ncbi:MAG: hypothetical protein HZA34_03640 [Candidatus Pacebacteria bacterium]|nr:hypothetical protein [Candidatus Paceibacterota bacterium]
MNEANQPDPLAMLDRQIGVVKGYADRLDTAKTVVDEQKTAADRDVNNLVQKAEIFTGTDANLAQVQDNLKAVQQRNDPQENGLFNLGKYFNRAAKEEERKLQGVVNNLQEQKQTTQHEYEEAVKVAAESSLPLQRTEEDLKRMPELLGANSRGGGYETSEKMTSALEKQDKLASSLKWYEGLHYDVNPECAFSVDAIGAMKDKFIAVYWQKKFDENAKTVAEEKQYIEELKQKKGYEQYSIDQAIGNAQKTIDRIVASDEYERKKADREANEAVVTMTGFFEKAVEYADEHGIEVSRNVLEQALSRGFLEGSTRRRIGQYNNEDGKFEAGYKAYLAELLKTKPEEIHPDLFFTDTYSLAAFSLDGLVKKHGLKQDASLIPEIIAYIGGVAAQQEYSGRRKLEILLRDLLVDVLEVDKDAFVREGRAWVKGHVKEGTYPLGGQTRWGGYGSGVGEDHRFSTTVSISATNFGTSDDGLREKIREANVMAKKIIQGIYDKDCLRSIPNVDENFGLPDGGRAMDVLDIHNLSEARTHF